MAHVIVNILQSLPAQTNKYASVARGHRKGSGAGQQRDTDRAYSSYSYIAGYGYATWKPNMASILIRVRLWLFVPLDLHCAAGGANNVPPSPSWRCKPHAGVACLLLGHAHMHPHPHPHSLTQCGISSSSSNKMEIVFISRRKHS